MVVLAGSPRDIDIRVQRLCKTYVVPERPPGLAAALRSLVRRHNRDVVAVDHVSFDVAPGEVVGFLGPNGAGKTTTLKMLAGLLHPTEGGVQVLGHEPWQRDRSYLSRIALIMGQRTQLLWDIPAIDSFDLNRAVYSIPRAEYRRTVDELVDLLDLASLLNKPVRNLSLGERMKCEMAAGLLHRPRVLFLDEPTIGLDVTMQRRIRDFVGEYNRKYGATVLLTSHYMADVEALCRRVLVIHHGRLLFDGELAQLVQGFSSYKTIVVKLSEPRTDMHRYGEVAATDNGEVVLRVPRGDTAATTARILAELPVVDLTVADPPIEEVIERVFAQGEAGERL